MMKSREKSHNCPRKTRRAAVGLFMAKAGVSGKFENPRGVLKQLGMLFLTVLIHPAATHLNRFGKGMLQTGAE